MTSENRHHRSNGCPRLGDKVQATWEELEAKMGGVDKMSGRYDGAGS